VRQREERAANELRKQVRECLENERKANAETLRDDFRQTGSYRTLTECAEMMYSWLQGGYMRHERKKPAIF
jgi:ERCC4-type nuclease